jgi:hypothetical protein
LRGENDGTDYRRLVLGVLLIVCTVAWIASHPWEGYQGRPPATWTMMQVFETPHACDQWVKAYPRTIQRWVNTDGLIFFNYAPRLACWPHTIDPRTQ